MAEGSMTYVVAKGYGFNQILIKSEKASNGSRNLGYQLDVQNSMCDMIVLYEVEHLGFVDITGVGQ